MSVLLITTLIVVGITEFYVLRKAKLCSATRICGWPSREVVQVLLQHADELILNDQQTTARKLASQLSVSKGGVKKMMP
jgi:predicted amino acid racemase